MKPRTTPTPSPPTEQELLAACEASRIPGTSRCPACGIAGVSLYSVSPPQGPISPPKVCKTCALSLGRIASRHLLAMRHAEMLSRRGHTSLAASQLARTMSEASRLRRRYKERELRSQTDSRRQCLQYARPEWETMSPHCLRQLRNRIRAERSSIGESLWDRGATLFSHDPELGTLDWWYWDDWVFSQLDSLVMEIEAIAELLREADEIANGDRTEEDPFSDPAWVRGFLRSGHAR
jgi:hypothetical protein